MTKKVFGLIMLSCLVSFALHGQDKLYLKNGGKMRGVYDLTQSTDTTLFFSMGTSGIHVPYDLIAGMRFSKLSRRTGLKTQIQDFLLDDIEKGYYTQIGIRALLGSHTYYYEPSNFLKYSIQAIHGYRWNNYLNVGGKLSIDSYHDFMSIPIAAHYEYEVSRKRIAPILSVGVGYGFVWRKSGAQTEFDKARGGLHYYMQVGYRIKMNKNDLLVNLGMQNQSLVQTVDEPDDPERWYRVTYQKRNMKRFTAGLSLTF